MPFYIPLGGHPSSSALRTSLNNLNLLVSSDRNNNSTPSQSACTAAAVAAATAAANSQSRLQTPPNSLWIPSIPPIEAGHPTRASYHGDNPSTSLLCNTGQSLQQQTQSTSAIYTDTTVTATSTTASDAAVAAAAAQIDEDYDVLLDQVLLLKNPPLPTPTHYGVETDLREDIIDTLSPLEPSPMRHSPLFHSSGQSGISRPFTSSYIDHTTNPLLVPHFSSSTSAGITTGLFTSSAAGRTSSGRPPFTRSQSVPEQSTLPSAIDLIHDSEQEELLLEAAANTLDEPLPILGLDYPVLPPPAATASTDFLRPLSRQSYLI